MIDSETLKIMGALLADIKALIDGQDLDHDNQEEISQAVILIREITGDALADLREQHKPFSNPESQQ